MKKVDLFFILGLLLCLLVGINLQQSVFAVEPHGSTSLKGSVVLQGRDMPGQSSLGKNSDADANTGALMFRNEAGEPLYQGKDGRYYISARQRMFIEAKDIAKNAMGIGVQKIEVKIDDQKSPYYEYIGSKTKKFSVGNEGDHVIYFRVVDRLNNTSEEMTRSITVDDTPPEPVVSYNAVGAGSSYEKKNIAYLPRGGNIAINAVDSGSGAKDVTVSRNEEPFKVYGLGEAIPIEKDGLNIIKVRATDNVLNVSTEYIYNVFVDVEPPCMNLSSQYALLNVGDDESRGDSASDRSGADIEVPSVEMTFNNGQVYVPGQEQEEVVEAGESANVGEGGEKKDGGWCSGKRPYGRYTSIGNKFYLQGYDRHSGVAFVEYRVGEEDWVLYEKYFQLNQSGPQKLEIRSTDFVGNQYVSSFDVVVDDLAPKTNVVAENAQGEIIAAGEGVQKKGVEENQEGSQGKEVESNTEEKVEDFSSAGIEIGPRLEE